MEDFFSFENLGGDYLRLWRDVNDGLPVAAAGLSDAQKYLLAACIPGRCVYLTADSLSAQRAYRAISTLTKRKCVLLPAKDEVLTYRRALSKDALFRRFTALYEWQRGADVLVLDVEAAIQLAVKKLPVFSLEEGGEYDMRALVQELVRAGYTREYAVEAKGAFAVRGDILDIFPINCENPVRIDFFGDEVEAIKPYDAVTGERLPMLHAIEIVAATDATYEAGEEETIRAALEAEQRRAPNAEAYARFVSISEEILADEGGNDYVLPLLQNACSLFSLVPRDAVVVLDECKLIKDKLEGIYKEHGERFRALREGGEAMSFAFDQYLPEGEFEKALKNYRLLAVQTFLGELFFYRALKLYNITSSPARRYLNSLPELMTDLRAWQQTGYRVLLYAGNAERKHKLEEELREAGFGVGALPKSLLDFKGVAVSEEEFERGFLLHESKLVVIGSSDLFTRPPERKRIKRKRGDLFVAPEVGDYAVHESYGIGKITGTQKIETTDGTKEYVALSYKDGDTLYVPVEQMDILSKYMGGDEPTLSKIGGGEFERVKARVRASLKKMAFDLKALYAERQEKRGYVFHDYKEELDEFAAAFPYEETPDQLSSFEEIKADMCSNKVMDRLLCGDVGFGKTEVALRAVYLCVLEGRQAALMCPSTVLSEQHIRTAEARMKEFGVRVAVLNRFKTERETKNILFALETGAIDFVIGTHRLLSSDVKFKDLGLLVLDEEQRFGVEHKEKIKNYKRDVDCLTMTATPIPRTLHLSLSGIRDISTIQTPPSRRLPVQTYVAEESDTLLRDAIVRELARGGQIFLLYNRVESIFTFANRVKALVPEARLAVAHGRMEKTQLENNVLGFYRGETDLLVTTTIIENGVDLPNANTLLVIDADRLGISQLYQLRGRVGRGSRLAHAYFLYKPERVMSANAAERLKAIMQFTELGSGYKIAMRDLEIRGAGNVLGAEQHGHMDKVGYELYAKILKEELTGERYEPVDLDVKATAFIPESYIESSAGRMDSYKQIAEIRSPEDYKRVCLSLEEAYGPMPEETLNLLVIAVIKSYASKFGVKKVSVSGKGGLLEFSSLNALSNKKLTAALDRYKGFVTVDMTGSPAFRFAPLASGGKTMVRMAKFLKFAATFT